LLLKALPHLKRIVTEDGYTVRDHAGRERFVVIYPRDVIAAIKVLQELAQFGTLPEGATAALPQATEEARLPVLPSPPLHFTLVSLPPDTEVRIDTPDVVDAEVEILD